MKARSREINIFNMSLLDILCGALGAFCFMMLVLFPFYSQDKGQSKRPDVQEGIDPKTFQEAKARIQQLEQDLQKFQKYADQLEARVKQLEAQSRQQQGDMQQMKDRAERGEMRNSILTLGSFAVQEGERVEVYIDSDRLAGKEGKPGPKMDPANHQDPFFTGDRGVNGVGAGVSYYMVRDTPRGSTFKVYVKFIKLNPGRTVSGYVIVSANDLYQMVDVKSEKDKVAVPVGVLKIDDDHNPKYASALPPENAAKQ
jgi:hypothetical protein